ncbi:hypothetical protein D5R81_12785 [Parashewanella spongiae]|uniref:Uncharacterized protein n=1 Tax=Parashewanella spongiae TaxID=342950 RepID=A0A3A6TT61_9GAMM|nr:hypothetical protein [Parashewanella spongiae]MCL1078794.1 hypothetical protein [Parashewanella spongiae]RJY11952.1 hypothetical protein D5R81_12785 [Parashewanella spongiae]
MSFSTPIFIRVFTAIFGGYGVGIAGSLGMIPISLWLFTNNPHDAVYIGMMISYVFCFGAFIWCFCCKTATAAVRDTSLFSLSLLSLYWLFPAGGSL